MDRSFVETTGSPSVVPAATVKVGSVAARRRVALTGIVVRVRAERWAGGPVLEIELRDETGSIWLAFLGRRAVGGVTTGALVTVAGTVGRHRGRVVILNPQVWLRPPGREGARAGARNSVDIGAVPGARGEVTSGNA